MAAEKEHKLELEKLREQLIKEGEEVIKNSGVILKQDDIEILAAEITGIQKDTIKTAFNGMWEGICRALENGHTVKLHGKGEFYLSKRSGRIGRNPATGEEYDVPEREAMAFRTSPAYAKRLRKRRDAKKATENSENK